MANSETTQQIETLAAELGELYLDIAKWHLRLDDAHLHQKLAERIYPILVENQVSEDRVLPILQNMMVKVGGGRREIPLIDLLPMQGQVQLFDILEEFQKENM
ncbi:DUF3181 family protein [Geitlerinema sp. PCC 9228]|jgi:deoxyhypusine synthase|uniref:DUF3181 family protein n=1 Tax=Geitlerinema sp. PCC 9228 TaxID=111611 RepID=UPI0008F9AE21|nr:DUF3181 family protein [Geitlerinema sp. PCC 9228]